METRMQIVAAVIPDEGNNNFLVGQRGRNNNFALKWEFIGGKVDSEDRIGSIEQTMKIATEREVLEELRFKTEAVGILSAIRVPYKQDSLDEIEVFFVRCATYPLGQIPDFDTQVLEQVIWTPRRSLITLDWVDADKKFATELAAGTQLKTKQP